VLVELGCFLIISTPKHTISFVDDLIWFQLLLNIGVVGHIGIFLGLPILVINRCLIKWDALLNLRLKLLGWLLLWVVYILDDLVGSSRQLIRIDCVVDIRYVLRACLTLSVLAILRHLKRLWLLALRLLLVRCLLFILVELLPHYLS
jgi:hypothetical protein